MSEQGHLGVLIEHTGPVEFDTIGDLISLLKQRVSRLGIKQAVYKRLLSVMIEALENIYRYRENYVGHPEITRNYPPHFIINLDEDCFRITSSNPILNQHIPELKQRLMQLEELNREGLKELYKKIITDGQFSDKGGAGLGIIEMAKSSDKVNFAFKPIDLHFSLYQLELSIMMN
ncbi:MAG: SiaB family protein kinase [Bacteroidales bacterium]|nr:SiaB family protein kinase [Bacteroidales bacterium]